MFIMGLYLIIVVLLTGCATQTPPQVIQDNSVFGPTYETSPYGCNNTSEGKIYYNNITHVPYICNSTNWTRMVN